MDDLLKRKELATKYANFIKDSKEENFTIALDSKWGNGKTRLISYICEEFGNETPYILYNAWENDYINEPLISLISELKTQCINRKYLGEDKLKHVLQSAYKSGKLIGKGSLKALLRFFAGEEATKDFAKGTNEAINVFNSEVTDKLIDNIFKEIKESKEARIKFTEDLKEIIEKILKEKDVKKFVIIIDELDRCKPTFAIELLENIKHLFEIENLVFLISVDKDQLSKSIKAVYGNDFDTLTYLYRFFDMTLYLDKPNEYKSLYDNKLSKYPFLTNYICKEFIIFAFEKFNLSLREFERILSEAKLLYYFDNQLQINLTFVLLILKYTNKQIFDELSNQKDRYSTHNSLLSEFETADVLKYLMMIGTQFKHCFEPNDLGYKKNELFKNTIKSINETYAFY
ncbi:KAP family P-loop NTPase fold protein [Arcobacter arenosus]|uniref:KAP family P-loop NTPase fold protein n=1 Tax=Arcobacter arenosus TaxID=2576037 RepID=UPI003BA88D5A